MALDALEMTTWTHWWEWNRGMFELPPARAVKPVSSGHTVVGADPRPRAALLELCRSTSVPLRTAAVQAAGRAGASADQLSPFLEDSAREVRLTTLLALGCGGTAAHAHALAPWLDASRQGEVLVAALAGFALLEEGPARRTLEPSVAALLGDERSEVQAAAAMATTDAALARAAARKLLKTASTSTDRAFAAQVLGRCADDEDVALLIELAAMRSVDVRRSAALASGRTRHAKALPALCDLLEKERDLSTRGCVLLGLGDHRGDDAEATLLRELTSGSKALRGFAALAIGVFGRGRDDTEAMGRAVAKGLLAERNRDQKGAYLLALGMLRHEASRRLVADHLSGDDASPTRGAAATALGFLGGEASIAPLVNALANDSCPGTRQQVARALANCGPNAIDALIAALRTEKDGHVRAGVLWALGSFDDVRATNALLACVADESENVDARAGGALSLGRAFRKYEPRMPELRFQHDDLLPPPIVGWAFGQEL